MTETGVAASAALSAAAASDGAFNLLIRFTVVQFLSFVGAA